MSYLDSLVASYEQEPVKPRSDATPLPQKGFVASMHELAEKANEKLPPAKHISSETIDTVLERASEFSQGTKMRAVAQYINTVENPNTNTPTDHRDLLPRNHPLSTRWISMFQARKEIAEYYETHPKAVDPELQSLVASAIASAPESVERKFYTEAISAKTSDLEPLAMIEEADNVIGNKTSRN